MIVELALAALAALPVNPDVTPATVDKTICVHGWSKTVRPPVSYTNKVKHAEMDDAGIPWSQAASLELDHRIPLILGGAPRDPRNLRLQSWTDDKHGWKVDADARVKDKLEVRLNRLVCSGQMKLDEAQRCIYDDWRACAKAHPPKGTQ